MSILQESGVPHDVFRYLDSNIGFDGLESLLNRLEGELSAVIRWNDSGAPMMRANIDVEWCAQILADNPRLLERPIVDDGVKATICRPPELVQQYL